MHARRLWHNERGAALVEFTIVLPLLLLLFALVVEAGNVLREHQMATQGVRDAVRYLSRVPDPSATEARDEARLLAERVSLQGTTIVMAAPVIADVDASTLRGPATTPVITVTASVDVPVPLIGPILRLFGGTAPTILSFTVVDQARHYGG
ncbi:MAG: TadE/TadG family type IV pilus assembly protein [Pseudomonadota bacterium]